MPFPLERGQIRHAFLDLLPFETASVKIVIYITLSLLASCISSQTQVELKAPSLSQSENSEITDSKPENSKPSLLESLFPSRLISLGEALRLGKDKSIALLKEAQKNQTQEVGGALDSIATKEIDPPAVKERRKFIKSFKAQKTKARIATSEKILAKFQCSDSAEAQALAFTLERDFPDKHPFEASTLLHEKVAACEGPLQQDSLLKASILFMLKDNCEKAEELIVQIQVKSSLFLADRISLLRKQCKPTEKWTARNPWSGYGILLTDPKLDQPEDPRWSLGVKSGSEIWDERLFKMIQLSEAGQTDTLRFFAQQLNAEDFIALPHGFQATLLLILHFEGIDFEVFRLLNKVLAQNPELMRRELTSLLYPVRYWDLILKNSEGLDPHFIKALVRQESAFNPRAQSRAKALGLMQLIPSAGRIYGVRRPKDLFIPEVNVRAGAKYIRNLVREFGSFELALAAYNAGPSNVRDWMERYPTPNKELFIEMMPYSETREYVRLVMRNYRMYQLILGPPPAENTTATVSDSSQTNP